MRRYSRHGRPVKADPWVEDSFELPRLQARERVRAYRRDYPKQAYMTHIKGWRELDGDVIRFTMRRLPSAD